MPEERVCPAQPLRTGDQASESCQNDASGIQPPLPSDGRRPLWPGDTRLGGDIQTPRITNANTGTLSGGRGRSPRSGRADGGPVGETGGAERHGGPSFDRQVAPGGYCWWYVDALSEDRKRGLTIIAFVGSVFSPYYAWSGWRDPYNHCAMNVALYEKGRDRWAMTERNDRSLVRDPDRIAIGRSSMNWSGDGLQIDIDEWTAPIPYRLRGAVRLRFEAIADRGYRLAADGGHVWRPIAPRASCEVDFGKGATSWRGEAYFDSNWGNEPLERRFRAWNWSRAHLADGDTVVHYDVAARHEPERSLALRFDRSATAEDIPSPSVNEMRPTFWRMRPRARGSADETPRLVRTLEDSPFYARSHLTGVVDGAPADIMHEALSLDRFRHPVVRMMLPFRMPRLVGRR